MDPSRYLLPLGDSSAGATRSVPPPRWYPSTCRSNDAPTIPASNGGPASNGSPASNGGPTSNFNPAIDGGGTHCSKSSTERGRTTPSGVPTPKERRRCRRCPRRRHGYWGCRRLLQLEQRSYIQGVPLLTELLQEAAVIPVEEKGSQAVCSIPPPRTGWPPSGRPVAVCRGCRAQAGP